MQTGDLGRQGPVPVAVVVVVMMAIARNIPPLERLFLLWTEGALYKLGRVLAGKFWKGAPSSKKARSVAHFGLCCLGTNGYGVEK